MIYIVQIEPLVERYSHWWQNYFPKKLREHKLNHQIIAGAPLTDKVEIGTVLDAAGTNYYKSLQLAQICKMFHEHKINKYDHFLICDIWFPGIEMIRYMSHLYNTPVNIWGIWHAGSSTTNDFAEPMHLWSKHFEVGFLNICDGIFVGSDYSRDSIIERLLYFLPDDEVESISSRIFAWGMPLNYNELQKYIQPKENIILFPHRPDTEKNPHVFANVIQSLSIIWDDFEKYRFIFCTSKEKYQSSQKWINSLLAKINLEFPNVEIKENLSKEAYYNLLGKSKMMVSMTTEENFGYCAVEAMALGTHPLLPNAFSHPEITSDEHRCLYNTVDELIDKIIKQNIVAVPELQDKVKNYGYVIDKWLEIMGK